MREKPKFVDRRAHGRRQKSLSELWSGICTNVTKEQSRYCMDAESIR